ncbi:MAG: hypothetical protein RR855_20230, partial [Comamonas sp.]
MTDLLSPPVAPSPAPAPATPADARAQVLPSLSAMLLDLPALLQSGDPMAPPQAAQLLHQTARALDVVQQPGLARLLRAMETALRQTGALHSTADVSPSPRDVLQLATKDALAHLHTLQAGRSAPVAQLFPAYRAVCKLGGKDSAHPADLWELRWQLAPVAAATADPATQHPALQVAPHSVAPATRALLDQQVLAVVKSADAPAAARLRDLCLGLAQTRSAPADTAFWQAAAGCFDATAHGLLEQDLYTKRLASRVLMHYASVAKAGDGAVAPPDTLVRDLLYYCAQAANTAVMVMDGLPPVLHAVCHSCQLLPQGAPALTTPDAASADDHHLTLDLGRGAEALAVPAPVATALSTPLSDPLAEPLDAAPAATHAAEPADSGLNLSHLVFGDEPVAPKVPTATTVAVAVAPARPAVTAPLEAPPTTPEVAPPVAADTTTDAASTSAADDATAPADAIETEAACAPAERITSTFGTESTALPEAATDEANAALQTPEPAQPIALGTASAVG